ncbi:S1 family peptidase [Mesorhizobium retamae]|uniref:Serine protease n=1 Tax=Mesorhizobium retamae TaxID=2912854 RepID=A0ABS9QHX3_9HYPH|nr:serine protease [Mesorhizobium sp. IRAMC:0171]MCG7507047.1 serine protease [Mesorhizobium sp. IRAMC:0171]
MRARSFAAALFAASMLAGCASTDPIETGGVPSASSVVRIETDTGLGSGVYIGGGVVITAAHVVATSSGTIKLRSDDGDVQQGEVLWINQQYDIAAVRPANSKRFAAASLSCRTPSVGEEITAKGNPFGLKFITMRGYVASKPSEYSPSWKSAFIVDVSMASGMSGGPAYDQYGKVVGINVGVVDPHGNERGSTSGFAFVVPSNAVCGLLGREGV